MDGTNFLELGVTMGVIYRQSLQGWLRGIHDTGPISTMQDMMIPQYAAYKITFDLP